jgi:hypothetical protein
VLTSNMLLLFRLRTATRGLPNAEGWPSQSKPSCEQECGSIEQAGPIAPRLTASAPNLIGIRYSCATKGRSLKYRYRVGALLFLLAVITFLDRVCISVAGPRIQEYLQIGP